MLTGASYSKHLIADNATFRKPPSADEHSSVTYYRNLMDYVLQYKTMKTAFVTPWNNLRDYLKQVDYSPILSTDIAVKDSTLKILNTTSLGAMIVNFRDVAVAGLTGGFTASNVGYKNAVVKTDEYVGNILTGLKARKNYANEDWLVILTTNHGGGESDPKPGFLILSNKNLKSEELKKTGFNTIQFNITSVAAKVPNDNGLYDAGATKDFTVQVQAQFNNDKFYSPFLSKSTGIDGSTQTGWLFFQTDSKQWCVSFQGSANGSTVSRAELRGGIVSDTQWHTLTMTVKTTSTTRIVTTYTDGNLNGTKDVFANKSLTTNEPLKLGFSSWGSYSNSNLQMADLLYFNTALDAATIKANVALKDMTKHPNYANLIGYWPINEGGEGLLNNYAPGGYNMLLSGAFTWKGFGANVPPSVVPDLSVSKSFILTNSSVTAAAMYWLKIPILAEFGVDGNPVLNQFEIEFLK